MSFRIIFSTLNVHLAIKLFEFWLNEFGNQWKIKKIIILVILNLKLYNFALFCWLYINFEIVFLGLIESLFLHRHGADEMALAGVIPSMVKLLSDPTEKVRETALNTLTDFYRHVGERLRADLQRKHNVPPSKCVFSPYFLLFFFFFLLLEIFFIFWISVPLLKIIF